MTSPFEVTSDDIEALGDRELTQLLQRLLFLEAEVLGLPKSHVSVSLKIDIPDGGQDGRLEWTGGPEPGGDWVPSRLNVFQVKATYMGPKACGDEILRTVKDDQGIKHLALKPKVQDVVDGAGAYLLIYGRHCEDVDDRIEKIRDAMASVNDAAKAAAVTIRVYGAEKIAEWVNQHAASVAFVLSVRKRQLPVALLPWQDWKEDWDTRHPTDLAFHVGQRAALFAELGDHLSRPKNVARLVGLSGLGKSRLSLELFAPPSDAGLAPSQQVLSDCCVYVKDGAAREREVEDALLAMRRRGVRGCIVVDECPVGLHDKLEDIVAAASSQLSLLTLDFEPDSNPRSDRCLFHRLEPLEREEIEEILRATYSELGEHIPTVAEFAQGYPRMAEFLLRAIQEDQPRLWDLGRPDVFKKLVVRRSKDQEGVFAVAQALSVLEHVGVYDDASYQLESFAKQLCGTEDLDGVYRLIRELEAAGIAYRRGDYVRVTPLPLAIMLAAGWWDACRTERAIDLLMGGGLPPEMVDATTNQLRRLKGHQFVEELVTKVMGSNSSFRRRDQLNSAPGSRLVSSLAEIHPVAVCDALTTALASMSVEEARAINAGRRNLVWALQKLAWWPETFADAAWMLLLLGAGENEHWANNASAQFQELFHMYLSGTECPAMERLSVVTRGLESGEPEIIHLCIAALGEAFASGHFSRSGGADAQGSGIRRTDWKPTKWGEIWEYWRASVELLRPYLVLEGEFGESARAKLASHARGMIRWGGLPVLLEAIALVREAGQGWPEMLDAVRCSLNYDSEELPDGTVQRLTELAASLEPTDLPGRLQQIVSAPSWNELRREPDGSVTMVAEERAKALGAELSSHPEELTDHFAQLLMGEQRQGFHFGHALGERASEPFEILKAGLATLRSIERQDRNPLVLMGLAAAIAKTDRELIREHLHGLLRDDVLMPHVADLIRATTVDDLDVAALASEVEAGRLPARSVVQLSLGRALEPIDDRLVARLVVACIASGEDGVRVALELLGMRLHREDIPDTLVDVSRTLTLAVASTVETASLMSAHHFEELVKKTLGRPDNSDDYLRRLSEGLLVACGQTALSRDGIRELVGMLLANNTAVAWPVFMNAMQADEWDAGHSLSLSLGGLGGDGLNLPALVGWDRLLDWCEAEPPARYWVSRMVAPLSGAGEDEKYPSWHPFALVLLEQFGDNEDVRSALSSSIHSRGWSGSAVPLLSAHRDAFIEMKRHPNRAVAQWAVDEITALDEWIAREKKRDEEREFGILR